MFVISRLSEQEDDGYRVSIQVDPFDLATALSNDESEATGAGGKKVETSLRIIHISVTWDEGFHERSVERVTFGYDALELAAPSFEAVQ